MPITRRPSANGSASPKEVNAVIARGGSVPRSNGTKSPGPVGRGPFIAVMLRIPERNLTTVDRIVANRAPAVSRNNWILEAILEKVLRDQKQ